MRLRFANSQRCRAFALVVVLVITGVSFLMVAGLLLWSSRSGLWAQRSNEFYGALAAAEAATEKVVAQMSYDFHTSGPTAVANNVASYQALVPTQLECPDWAGYEFSNAAGTPGQTYVLETSAWQYSPLRWKYSALSCSNAVYRVISNARMLGSGNNITAALRQDVQIAAVPVFSFAYFYNLDLEHHPWQNWTVDGKVHGNGANYFKPSASLTFANDVTASHRVVHAAHPLDPEFYTFGSVTYQAATDAKTGSLSLPLGTNNNSVAHKLIEIPSGSESALIAAQRYYNKADLIILVSNAGAQVTDRAWFPVSDSIWTNFVIVRTNTTFYDEREDKPVRLTEIDVAQFMSNYTALANVLVSAPKILYVADQRTPSSNPLAGVKVVNGAALPDAGLTIATMNPLYVKGPYNTSGSPKPASLVGDAVTLLSSNWTDTNVSRGLSLRIAANTTFNTAVVTGIVPADGTHGSGGLQNAMRLMEDWSGRTVTFKGSLAVLYVSQMADARWEVGGVYGYPASRAFTFDQNFLDPLKLPPGYPEAYTVIRTEWEIIQPGTIP